MALEIYLSRRVKGNSGHKSSVEVAYWYKANAIRKWFAENLDGFVDNGETMVPLYKLDELLWVCEEVSKNHSQDVSSKLLPTCEGPFFGSIKYDRWYYSSVDYAITRLKQIIEETDSRYNDIVYREMY